MELLPEPIPFNIWFIFTTVNDDDNVPLRLGYYFITDRKTIKSNVSLILVRNLHISEMRLLVVGGGGLRYGRA